MVMRSVPWWGVVSSAAAPVLLAGGWAVAAALQPRPVNAVADTISSLAAGGLRPAAAPGRLILISGGVAGLLVAANPEPARGGSLPHGLWAPYGFLALAVWPVGSRRRGPWVPYGLRAAVTAVASGALLGLLVWFGAELITRGGQIGLAERVLTEAQAVWPLAVVLTCRQSPLRARPPPAATSAS